MITLWPPLYVGKVHHFNCYFFGGAVTAVAEWVRALAWTDDRTVPGRVRIPLRQLRFGTLAIPFTPLCHNASLFRRPRRRTDTNNIWPEWQFFNVAGYLYVIEESRRSTDNLRFPMRKKF